MPSTSTRPPFEAYRGTDPYLFISYAHRDSEQVFPELVRLKGMGLHIWYDEGIDPGNEWRDEIANAVRKCSCFIYFVSARSVASVNCRNEVVLAEKIHKPFLSIYIEETNILEINAGIELTIGALQAIMKYQMDEESYQRQLDRTMARLMPGSTSSSSTPPPSLPAADPPKPEPRNNKAGEVVKQGATFALRLGPFSLQINLLIYAAVVLVFSGLYVSSSQLTVTETFHQEVPGLVGNDPAKMEAASENAAELQALEEAAKQKALEEGQKEEAAKLALEPKAGQAWQNSLGMKFVPAGTTNVLFAVYDTRVKDFQAFVVASGYDATSNCLSLGNDGWKQRGDSWKSPGFNQGPDYPVVGVNWNDAEAFCHWLTDKDHKEGTLGSDQSYRLPTDGEWSIAAGNNLYPWGDQWPPPKGAGNYASEGDGAVNFIAGYKDGYPRTSPVGTFKANSYGLYDMGGNTWQWCEDWYVKSINSADALTKFPGLQDDGGGMKIKVLRGASWYRFDPVNLRTSYRTGDDPTLRVTNDGFRVVVVLSNEDHI